MVRKQLASEPKDCARPLAGRVLSAVLALLPCAVKGYPLAIYARESPQCSRRVRQKVRRSTGEKSPYRSLTLRRGFERFYEKVIKVKADVAALLNLFSDVSIDFTISWERSQTQFS